MVEKIAPNAVPDHPLFWNQYAPMVISHAPQTKNWRKFITISRSFRLTRHSPLSRRPHHAAQRCAAEYGQTAGE
jgi:hypothetical protein